MALVQHVLGMISNEMIMKLAAHAVPATMALQPIEPLAGEKTACNWSQQLYFSPERQMLGFADEVQGEDSVSDEEEGQSGDPVLQVNFRDLI